MFHKICNWVALIGVAAGGTIATIATFGVAMPAVVLGIGAAAGVVGGVAAKYALSPVPPRPTDVVTDAQAAIAAGKAAADAARNAGK